MHMRTSMLQRYARQQMSGKVAGQPRKKALAIQTILWPLTGSSPRSQRTPGSCTRREAAGWQTAMNRKLANKRANSSEKMMA